MGITKWASRSAALCGQGFSSGSKPPGRRSSRRSGRRKAGAKTVADPRANGARGQRRAIRNGVADIGRQKRHHQGQSGDANIKQFFQVGIRRAIGHGALPYSMTETARRIPPETTKGIICETPVMRCWRVFLVFAPVRSLLAPERACARDSIVASTVGKWRGENSREKCIYWIFVRCA